MYILRIGRRFRYVLSIDRKLSYVLRIGRSRVSKSHGHTVVRSHKKFLTWRKILRFACATLNLCILISCTVFSSFFTYIR